MYDRVTNENRRKIEAEILHTVGVSLLETGFRADLDAGGNLTYICTERYKSRIKWLDSNRI